jgi:Zn-dependent protease
MAACVGCGVSLQPEDLSCPACRQLVHSEPLRQLADQARNAEAAGDKQGALTAWKSALPMLPADSVQRRSIEKKVTELRGEVEAAGGTRQSLWKRGSAGLGPVALMIWKFKTAALIVLTKGKLILLGLTKVGTLLSMFASIGVYWALFGWPFAVGLVLSIYVHEMGHVIALRSFGIPAGAPMFIPGFGAIIQMRGLAIGPVEDARVGLAGPIYGCGAALFCLAAYYLTGAPIWRAIAHLGAVINLFNLIPVWQLDGARGFHSLTSFQRKTIAGAALVLWIATSEVMLLFIAGVGFYRLFTRDAATAPDNTGWMQFAGLLVILSAILVFAGR